LVGLGIELGLGARNSTDALDDPSRIAEGLRIVGRMPLSEDGTLVVEGTLFVRTAPLVASSTAEVLVAISHQGDPDAGFQLPFTADSWTTGALVDWGFGGRSTLGAVECGPRLLGGAELRRATRYNATYNDTWVVDGESTVALSAPEKGLLFSFVAGLAFDAWVGDWAGLRVGWYSRVRPGQAPDYDPNDDTDVGTTLENNPVFAIDLMVRL